MKEYKNNISPTERNVSRGSSESLGLIVGEFLDKEAVNRFSETT